MKRLVPLAAIALAACASDPAHPEPDVGRILTYIRSNSDATEAETVHIHRAALDRIEVIKTREPCTNAAFVVAHIDPRTGEAVRLEGGRLRPGATHEIFAWLTVDDDVLNLRMGREDAPPSQSVTLRTSPWHLYDFDLATLVETPPPEAVEGRDFRFGLALALVQDDGLALSWLGPADARLVGTGREAGRDVRRYRVSGDAFPGSRGGDLAVDARDGKVISARFGLPNHAEYSDFQLVLQRERRGADMWRRMQLAHFEDCPTEE